MLAGEFLNSRMAYHEIYEAIYGASVFQMFKMFSFLKIQARAHDLRNLSIPFLRWVCFVVYDSIELDHVE